jgi:hypothetical protein
VSNVGSHVESPVEFMNEKQIKCYEYFNNNNIILEVKLFETFRKLQPIFIIDSTDFLNQVLKEVERYTTCGCCMDNITDSEARFCYRRKIISEHVWFDERPIGEEPNVLIDQYQKYFRKPVMSIRNYSSKTSNPCGDIGTAITNLKQKTTASPIQVKRDLKQVCSILLKHYQNIEYCNHELYNKTMEHKKLINEFNIDKESYFKSSKLKIFAENLRENSSNTENFYQFQYFVISGLLLIFFSLFFKLSLAPFHLWSPDVYENSPTSSSFFFAVVPKISIFVVLVRLVYSSFFFAFDWIQELLLVIAILSIMAGSLGGLYQRKIKSLLAYSSISHMGYLMIAFSSASIEGLQMLFCYLIVYTLTGLCIWSSIIIIRLKKKDKIKQNKDLADLVLLSKSNYVLALVLMSALFSIAGIPPLVGFIAKMNIFLVAMENKLYIVSIISVLFSVISTFFYLRLIKIMYFEPLLVGRLYYPINSSEVFVIIALFLSLIFFFVNPTLLYLLAYKISYLFI